MAICFHNFFDGWIAGLTEHVTSAVRSQIVTGLLAHKVPEAALFGMMLRSAAKASRGAVTPGVLTAATILLGGLSHDWLRSTNAWTITLSLALTCASFLFLGAHIFSLQRQLFGTRSAFTLRMWSRFAHGRADSRA